MNAASVGTAAASVVAFVESIATAGDLVIVAAALGYAAVAQRVGFAAALIGMQRV